MGRGGGTRAAGAIAHMEMGEVFKTAGFRRARGRARGSCGDADRDDARRAVEGVADGLLLFFVNPHHKETCSSFDSHLCRTWLAGTASRPVAARDAGWTPVAVALGPIHRGPKSPSSPPVEEASPNPPPVRTQVRSYPRRRR